MRGAVGARLLFVLATVCAVTAVGAEAANDRRYKPAASVREEREIYGVARASRRAVLTDRPAVVCSLLTPRAQRRALAYNNAFEPPALTRAAPTTCEQAVANFIADLNSSGDIPRVHDYPGEKRLRILRVRGRRAEVEVGGHGIDHLFNVHLRKTAAGWRGDSASFQPFGAPFGR